MRRHDQWMVAAGVAALLSLPAFGLLLGHAASLGTITAADLTVFSSSATPPPPPAGDTTAPTVVSLSIPEQNHKPDTSDTLTITFSEAIDPNTICDTWPTDYALTARVTITDGGSPSNNDVLSATTGECGVFALGSINLGHSGFVSGTVAFDSSSVTYNDSDFTLTITLGSTAGVAGTTANASVSPTYSPPPAPGIRDLAGNRLQAEFTAPKAKIF